MNKKWEIYQTNEEKVEKLQEKYKLNRLLSTYKRCDFVRHSTNIPSNIFVLPWALFPYIIFIFLLNSISRLS